MAVKKFYRVLFLCLLLFLISNCAYPISKQLREEINKNLTFPMALEDPTKYIGSIVIWGGVIIQTVNLKDGTEIMVLQTPLGGRERPEGEEYSQGRFIAKSPGYLDAEIYRRGREITVAGEIIGKEIKPLGEIKYTYPVVEIKELHLWTRERIYYVEPYRGYYPWGYWGNYPFGWGYWGYPPDWDYFYEGDFDDGDFDEGGFDEDEF
jgi:outer membrane lipoprotein